MADGMIGAAPAGQPGTISGGVSGTGGQSHEGAVPGNVPGVPGESNQLHDNYVTSEQLNAALDRMERMIQSSTDKSYNRVQKMISSMQQAGIQNPTEAQARAMLALQEKSEQQQGEPEAQPAASAAASPEAEAWIKANGGDVTQDCWNDIYDAAQEAGVGMITREDPEYAQFFMENGQTKSFKKPRKFVRAFEQAFEAKKQRLGSTGNGGQSHEGAVPGVPGVPGNLASSPALGGGGSKNNYHDPKTTDRTDLISQGLRGAVRR